MAEPRLPRDGKTGVSRTAVALGAAGLFLFIVGVKRKYRLDAEREVAAERGGGGGPPPLLVAHHPTSPAPIGGHCYPESNTSPRQTRWA
jgi:hypothetical protein